MHAERMARNLCSHAQTSFSHAPFLSAYVKSKLSALSFSAQTFRLRARSPPTRALLVYACAFRQRARAPSLQAFSVSVRARCLYERFPSSCALCCLEYYSKNVHKVFITLYSMSRTDLIIINLIIHSKLFLNSHFFTI